jgi:hypothetical protein
MKIQIKSIANIEIKGLILTFLFTALISETVQAQSIPTINVPNISILRPSINIPKPTIKVPKPTIKIELPSIANAQKNIFQQPTTFVIKGAENNTRPSFISVTQNGINLPQIQTGIGKTTVTGKTTVNTTINIPTTTTTLSNVNVVVPSTNIVAPGTVNLNVNTTEIPTFGSLINTVNLSFPLPVLD